MGDAPPKPMFDVVVIGNLAVGKTSLIRRFMRDTFHDMHVETVGVDFCLLSIVVGGTSYIVRILDTPGAQQFQEFTRIHLRHANGVILVYSVNDRESFQSLPSWLETIRQANVSHVPLAVVGNKTDCSRQVSVEEGRQFAQSRPKTRFYETSCLTGDGTDTVREGICNAIVAHCQELQIPLKMTIETPFIQSPPSVHCRCCH
jgi:small GTP-binding protein